MNDLISRKEAIDAINEYETNAPEYMQECDCKLIEAVKSDIVGLISELPSAVKHGKWIPINERAAKCSLCGEWEYTNGIDKTGTAIIHRAIKHYCPNCGAKMEIDEDDRPN